MTAPIIALFNNKGGVGKTSLVYHLACMYADLGLRVVALDLDPQANLTAMFLEEDRLEDVWPEGSHPRTAYGAIGPLLKGTGDLRTPIPVELVEEDLGLVAGDLALSGFEDELSEQWPKCLDGKERAFRVLSAFWRLAQGAIEIQQATLALVDVGPNLGAINRAALIAASHVVVPVAADIFSLQGLRNLGPTLRRWRIEWAERRAKLPSDAASLAIPPDGMQPLGYVVLQHAVRLDRPAKAYGKWMERIPPAYWEHVLGKTPGNAVSVAGDPNCLATLKHFRSLMPMAQEARKPMFRLQAADGAIGSHVKGVQDARQAFEALAREVARRAGLGELPGRSRKESQGMLF